MICSRICLVYITNMRSNDFNCVILTIIMIILMFFIEYRENLIVSWNIFNHYIFDKNCKKYRKNCEDTMTKILVTYIRNINKTFIIIFTGIPLGYIVYYHHGHD